MPNLGDANIEENDYSEEYNGVAHGAKLCHIPEVAIINGNEVDWSMASDFLFETTLIQYNADGELIMYPEQTLDLTPVYTPAQYVSGEQSITTAIV